MRITSSRRILCGIACAFMASMAAGPALASGAAAAVMMMSNSSSSDSPAFVTQQDVAKVEGVGVTPAGVKLEAWIQRGQSAHDGLRLNVNLMAPQAKRVCIAYIGFEVIGFVRGGPTTRHIRMDDLDKTENKCSDQSGQDSMIPFKDSVSMKRRDLPESAALMRPNFENLPETEQRRRASFRDGYVIVVVSLDGQPAIFRIDSNYFSLNSLILK